jgi:signal transduction histidine kinase
VSESDPQPTRSGRPDRDRPDPSDLLLDPPPVFPRRLSRGQLIAIDAVAAAVATLFVLGLVLAGPVRLPSWAISILLAAIGPPVAARRLWPLPVFAVVFAATLVAAALGVEGESILVPAFALYAVALTEPRHPKEPTLVIGVISVVGLLVATLAGPGEGGAGAGELLIVGPAALGGAWTIGRAVRERRAYAARTAEQVAARAADEERLRIARELHDVVSHTLSLIGVKAGVAGYLLESRAAQAGEAAAAGPGPGGSLAGGSASGQFGPGEPGAGGTGQGGTGQGGTGQGGTGQGGTGAAGCGAGAGPATDAETDLSVDADVREALRVIETTSRDALGEMRQVLGLLRSDDAPADLRPAAGMEGLADLADRAAMAGVRVDVTLRGAAGLPEGMGRAVYRIVREAVTNVVRHAAPTRCRIVVEGLAEEVRIRVTDDGPGDRALPGPPGHGIIGMRERAHMYGGTLTAGPRPEGGFEVFARLPRRPPEDP